MTVSLSSVALSTEIVPLSAPGGPPERSALSASAMPRTPCSPIPGVGRYLYALWCSLCEGTKNMPQLKAVKCSVKLRNQAVIQTGALFCIDFNFHVRHCLWRHAPTRSPISKTHSAQRQGSNGPSHWVPGGGWTTEQVKTIVPYEYYSVVRWIMLFTSAMADQCTFRPNNPWTTNQKSQTSLFCSSLFSLQICSDLPTVLFS